MKDIFLKTLMLKGEAGGTITSIEKIEAQEGVMQMRMNLSDGTVLEFPVNDVPDEELINQLIELGTQDIAATIENLTTVITATISADDWSESAPYEYTLAAPGVTALDDFEIVGFTPTPVAIINKAVKEALSMITYGTTGTDSITFVAVDEKPTVDIPIVLRKVVN